MCWILHLNLVAKFSLSHYLAIGYNSLYYIQAVTNLYAFCKSVKIKIFYR